MKQGMKNPGSLARSAEGFVPWKEPPGSALDSRHTPRTSREVAAGRKKQRPNDGTDSVTMSGRVDLVRGCALSSTRVINRSSGSEAGGLASAAHTTDLDSGGPHRFIPPRAVQKQRIISGKSTVSFSCRAKSGEVFRASEGAGLKRGSMSTQAREISWNPSTGDIEGLEGIIGLTISKIYEVLFNL